MTAGLTPRQLEHAGEGYDPVAARSASIGADCYIDPGYLDAEREQIFRRSWQYLCHEEALREPGSYSTGRIQDRSIFAVRGEDGALRAFYNVCRHRGHELLSGAGTTARITCPYHAWVYDLEGRLHRARRSELIENFDPDHILLTPVQVEVFLPPRLREPRPAGAAARRADGRPCRRSGGVRSRSGRSHLRASPDLYRARQLEGGRGQLPGVLPLPRRAPGLRVPGGDGHLQGRHPRHLVQPHGPGRPSAESGLRGRRGERDRPRGLVPLAEHDPHALSRAAATSWCGGSSRSAPRRRTRSSTSSSRARRRPSRRRRRSGSSTRCCKPEDIGLVESVQRGMRTPAFQRGRYLVDPDGSGLSEHAVHHFHGLVLDAYRRADRRADAS